MPARYSEDGHRWCSQGQHYTNVDDFGRDKNRPEGLNRACRPCIKARTKELAKFPRPKRSEMPCALAPKGQKWCNQCQSYKIYGAFYRHRGTSDGMSSPCKECHKTNDTRDYYEKTYGIARSIVDALWEQQKGYCAICVIGLPSMGEARFDHCHSSGQPRGFLCHNCNVALGHLRDDPALLRAAIIYLEGGE